MKNALIFANWKSNKSKNEAKKWFEEVGHSDFPDNLKVVIFPPFTLLDILSGYIKVNSLPFKLGAQDISPFDRGAYTGEISASQIKEFAEFVLIGHSERRTNFGESDEVVRNKVDKAIEAGLIPVVCISNLDQIRGLGEEKVIFAYEPIGSIGTGNPEDPALVDKIAGQIKEKTNREVIYGGSVNADNIKKYLSLENISGSLIGGASLDPSSFKNVLKNAV